MGNVSFNERIPYKPKTGCHWWFLQNYVRKVKHRQNIKEIARSW